MIHTKKFDFHLVKEIIIDIILMPLLRFKYLDAHDYHIEDDTDNSKENYVIRFFGRTALDDPNYPDKSVCMTVSGFTPFFFIKINNQFEGRRIFNKLSEVNKDLIQYVIRNKFDFQGFQAEKECLFLQLIFRTAKAMRKTLYNKMLNRFQLYESNIDPILKLMHVKGISGCSWISIDDNDIDFSTDISYCDIEGEVHWENIHSSTTDNTNGTYSRLRVLSYDIETMSTDPDGGFPQAHREGDCVIQIGMTFNYYHHPECYKKYLVSLKDCDSIDETIVINCSTEKELLATFIKIIINEDPDIITGYNIFGFDNKYLCDRAKRISTIFYNKFSEWGRLKDKPCYCYDTCKCRFITKNLSSSALGDNILYYFESEGRVQIDLYKVIQRDHNLEMYKLDFVSSHFNQNLIKNLNDNTFETPNISGLEKDGYFKIKMIENLSGVEDFYSDEKYRVISINNKTIQFEGKPINLNLNEYTLKWCMAKDDLPAQKIFEYWPIDSAHRQIIGKYCIKDCILVNFLLEKLDIISTNMAMSYVCWVPLYYIFIRGQGIKAFSLVAQQCRKDNYIIPAIKKTDFLTKICKLNIEFTLIDVEKCTNEPCESKQIKEFINGERACTQCNCYQYYSDYEGAKVYEPKPNVYWQPISVLDYASLYPRSIISRNMSWETQVLDPTYDNLPDYKYYDVSYKDSRNKIIECRFAQKLDGSLGIIPKILFNLLDERDSTKKKMKKETDPFKKKILDGHQLALKITANSLYGQLGAITSPVYRKDIAACTTAVGQHMLGVAQEFMENKFINELMQVIEEPSKYPIIKEEDINFIKDVFNKYTFEPKIIYGDSVTADTPLLLRKDNLIYIKTIDSISSEWIPYNEFKSKDLSLKNKEQSSTDYEVWTNGKWSKIIRVIRHQTNKKIYRVNTHQGVIDVTEDHSLIDENTKLLKPNDCICNETKLLQSYPEFSNVYKLQELVDIIHTYEVEKYTLSELEAFMYGFFYNSKNNIDKNLLAVIKKIIEFKCKDAFMYGFFYTGKNNIDETVSSVIKKITEFKCVETEIPTKILNGTYHERLHFFLGYYVSSGAKYSDNNIKFYNKEKLSTAQLYYLIKSLGYTCNIVIENNIYTIVCLESNFEDCNIIKKIEEQKYDNNIVYDLETEEGIFQAGIGEIIVKNTDSVFTNFQLKNDKNEDQTDRTAREVSIKLGILAGKLVKPYLDYPHDLEYEKTFHPWLVLCKKKYAGAKYEENPDKFSMNYMGIVLKRRDNAKIVKKICGGILNILFKERDYKKVEQYTKDILLDLINDKFDISYFVTTKKLSGTYKGKKLTSTNKGVKGTNGSWSWDDVECGQAHVKLCQRMKQRDIGSAPQINDRISFVQVFDKNDLDSKNKLQGDKIEEVSYVLDNKLQLDYLYYIENQIENPACQFLELIINKPEEVIFLPIKQKILNSRYCEKMKINGGIFKKARSNSKKQKKENSELITDQMRRMISNLKAPKETIKDNFAVCLS